MVATTKTIKNTWVSFKVIIIFYELVFFFLGKLEIFNSAFEIFDEVFAKTSTEITFWKILIDWNSPVKVSDGQLMIPHILINSSTSNIHGLIIIYFLNNFWKAFKSFLETISSMLHKTKMELTAYEVWLQFKSLLIHIYC